MPSTFIILKVHRKAFQAFITGLYCYSFNYRLLTETDGIQRENQNSSGLERSGALSYAHLWCKLQMPGTKVLLFLLFDCYLASSGQLYNAFPVTFGEANTMTKVSPKLAVCKIMHCYPSHSGRSRNRFTSRVRMVSFRCYPNSLIILLFLDPIQTRVAPAVSDWSLKMI